ncbi:hypothetical protein BJ912DRAFT_1032498 [Pholiota molesta]|nr:hypothetical protein BJ912DRAFT_1032498 [Pholiota molesta]
MASDSSDSPLVLTPESTGTGTHPSSPTKDILGSLPGSPALAAKKARRQTAFYPNTNANNKPVNPFSKSAAKRESVMALGSIEHLQHYFTKTGIAAKKNPLNKPHHGLVPAIGGLQIPTSPAHLSSIADEFDIQLPPSPMVPPPMTQPAFSPHVKTYEVDPESLLPGVIEDVVTVAQAWKLESPDPKQDVDVTPDPRDHDLDVPFDVLDVLKTTTRAIRSTRNYLLSLPDESAGTIRSHFRPHLLGPTRNLARISSNPNLAAAAAAADPITLIRRGALEVLTVLRQLEESCRLPLEDEAYDARSDKSGDPASSPSHAALELAPPHALELERSSSSLGVGAGDMSFSLVQVQGRFESVLVWEDEDDGFGADGGEEAEAQRRRERWDERLVLGSGWLYRQDVRLGQLRKERAVVGKYLDLVDEVLFDGKKEDGKSPGEAGVRERGWERVRRKREGRASSRAAKNRRVSAGMVAKDAEGGAATASSAHGILQDENGRRRVSTGMIHIMRGMTLSDEPEDMMGEIREEDEEEGAYRGRPWDKEVVEEEEIIDDEDLPVWAKRSAFVDDPLGRVHALIASFLPAHLIAFLVSPADGARTAFLSSLSSGQLLCAAYNTCVRKSKRPWGFVSPSGGGGQRKGGAKKAWTFRRTDNLRLWAGALKLRYSMPIQVPSQRFAINNAHGLARAKADREPPIIFDARVIAKKDEGWEQMLEVVLLEWVERVVRERRVFVL